MIDFDLREAQEVNVHFNRIQAPKNTDKRSSKWTQYPHKQQQKPFA